MRLEALRKTNKLVRFKGFIILFISRLNIYEYYEEFICENVEIAVS